MNVTFAQTADAILSRHRDFRDNLVKALGGLAGNCFIDGRVGRSPPDDCVILVSRDRENITVHYYEFDDSTTIKQIVKQWSSPPKE